jgi:hypothetical protein
MNSFTPKNKNQSSITLTFDTEDLRYWAKVTQRQGTRLKDVMQRAIIGDFNRFEGLRCVPKNQMGFIPDKDITPAMCNRCYWFKDCPDKKVEQC